MLSACGGGSDNANSSSNTSSSSSNSGSTATVANQAPTISTTNRTVTAGETVTLSAQVSDSDGTISEYSWQQSSGTAVTLSNESETSVSFIAPIVTDTEQLAIMLTVKDDDGAESSATIIVTVKVNTPPLVTVEDMIVEEQSSVEVVAAASDIDGGIASYVWEQISGPEVLDLVPNGNTLTFTTPDVHEDVTAKFKVIVTDGFGGVTEKVVDIMIKAVSYTFSIDGKVGDSVIGEADLIFTVNDAEYTVEADENGRYLITFEFDKAHGKKILTATATIKSDTRLVLSTIFGSVEELVLLSGEDRILTVDELLMVNINSFSTALHALINSSSSTNHTIDTQDKLNEKLTSIDDSELNQLSALLHLTVSHTYTNQELALAPSIETTLKLANDPINLVSVKKKLHEEQNFSLLEEHENSVYQGLQRKIVNKQELKNTTLYLNTLSSDNDDKAGARLLLEEGNTGFYIDQGGQHAITWDVAEGVLDVKLVNTDGVVKDDFCPLNNTYLSCSHVLLSLKIEWFAPLSGLMEPMRITQYINKVFEESENGTDEETNDSWVVMNESKNIRSATELFALGQTYTIPIAKIEIEDDSFSSIPSVTQLERLQVTLHGNESDGGTASVEYPIAEYSGTVSYELISSDWVSNEDGTITLTAESEALIKSVNIAIFGASPLSSRVNVLVETSEKTRVDSGTFILNQSTNSSIQVTDVIGSYCSDTYLLFPLFQYCFILNADSSYQYFYVNDANYNGSLEDTEIYSYQGAWLINDEDKVVLSRHRLLDETGYPLGDDCSPVNIEVADGADCILYSRDEWTLTHIEQNESGKEPVLITTVFRYFQSIDYNNTPTFGTHYGVSHAYIFEHILYINQPLLFDLP